MLETSVRRPYILIALVATALSPHAAGSAELDLDFLADDTSTYYEYFSAGFYRMDLYSPAPNDTNQSFHEIGNPSNIFNQAFDGFPNDNDFRFGSLTYDDSGLIGGTGVANITALNLGIPIDPDDPAHVNSARWASGTTTEVDGFSGTVSLDGGVVTSVDLNSDIRLVVVDIGGSTIPGAYLGTFDMIGLDFGLNVTGAPEIDLFGNLPVQPFELEWDFSGALVVRLTGDGNGDGWVDGQDYLIWANAFGNDPADPLGAAGGDFNGDEIVDGLDYLAWAGNFGAHSSTPVPEPATGVLAMGLVGLAVWPRKRRNRNNSSVA